MSNEYNFFMDKELSAYLGEWIAILDKEIISHGKDLKKVYEEAKLKYPKARPLITKVADKNTMIF